MIHNENLDLNTYTVYTFGNKNQEFGLTTAQNILEH